MDGSDGIPSYVHQQSESVQIELQVPARPVMGARGLERLYYACRFNSAPKEAEQPKPSLDSLAVK
jgi:hypothetical protein